MVAAHDEEDVITRRLENLLALDYPPERLAVVVASDGSTDGTDAAVQTVAGRDARVTLVSAPRRGKVPAQDAVVAALESEIVAFTDANALWSPGALRALVRSFADPAVGYVTGRASYEAADGTNREGAYWRFELFRRKCDPLDFRAWKRDSQRELKKLYPGRPLLLDSTAGLGDHTVNLAEEGFEVEACDVSEVALEATRRAVTEAKLDAPVFRARWEALDRPGRYDLVFNDALHWTYEPDDLRAALRGFQHIRHQHRVGRRPCATGNGA